MLSRNGYLMLGRWRGAAVRAHWTLPLAAFIFGQARFVPGFWTGFFLIVLIHEIGHARVVRRFKYQVISIDLHGVGGTCRWTGDAQPIQRATIAWGGVNAQAVAFFVAVAAMTILGPPRTPFAAQLASAFTVGNAWLIALNLIPVPPLDGAEAWKLPALLRARRRNRTAASARERSGPSLERELAALDASERAPHPRAAAAARAALQRIVSETKPKKG
jgi:hypothetical protein